MNAKQIELLHILKGQRDKTSRIRMMITDKEFEDVKNDLGVIESVLDTAIARILGHR